MELLNVYNLDINYDFVVRKMQKNEKKLRNISENVPPDPENYTSYTSYF